ncbi:GNAT family N-acetyltransferase [Vibrio sonorensis]|uniref:GNAT family N-acetyltransferase n=1 Tax=Vibrio sonorensis TaxID=1004316 RepID=UPI001586BA39|nr:GNAT family N-acetyltransferase [Vibrio sonorensis]
MGKLASEQDAIQWCSDRADDWKRGQGFVWLCRNPDQQVVGQVSLIPQTEHSAVAYWIDPQLWGKGIATQMCNALINHLIESGFKGKLWAGVHHWNGRSAAVLSKLGFEQKPACKDSDILEFEKAM